MRLDRILLALIAVIFIVHIFAVALFWYDVYPRIDIPMHMAGGFWLGLLFAYLFLKRHQVFSVNTGFIPLVFLGAGFVALIGVGWEFYEYLSYVFVTHAIPFGGSVPGMHFDTLKDLFDDLLGGTLAITLYLSVRRTKQ